MAEKRARVSFWERVALVKQRLEGFYSIKVNNYFYSNNY